VVLIVVALLCIMLISWAGSAKPGNPAQESETTDVPALAIGALSAVHLE
jgi:hypothetical protein